MIEVSFKVILFANTGFMIRSIVDNEWFLEYTSPHKGASFWEHGMVYSWDKSGYVPDLTVLSEEELFQFSTAQEFSETEKMLAVQKFVLKNIKFIKKRGNSLKMTLEY